MRSSFSRFSLPFAAIALIATGCSSGATGSGWTYGPTLSTASSVSPAATAPAAPSGSVAPSASAVSSATTSTSIVRIAAKNIAFDQTQLTAPANRPFQIVFDNQESGIPHNVAIYSDPSASTAVFTGEIFPGPAERTYSVPALKAGSYFFRCDVHPTQMTGTLVVQ